MNKQSPISRRQAIGGLGTGLVAVAAPRIFAAKEARNKNLLCQENYKIRPANIRNRLSTVNRNRGRGWPVKWIRVRIMVRKATRAPAA